MMQNAISHTTVFLTSLLLSYVYLPDKAAAHKTVLLFLFYNMIFSIGLVFLQITTKDKE